MYLNAVLRIATWKWSLVMSIILYNTSLLGAQNSSIKLSATASEVSVGDAVKFQAVFPSVITDNNVKQVVAYMTWETSGFHIIYDWDNNVSKIYDRFNNSVISHKYTSDSGTSTNYLEMKVNHCLNEGVKFLVVYSDLNQDKNTVQLKVKPVLPEPEMHFYQAGVCQTCADVHSFSNDTGNLTCTVKGASKVPVMKLEMHTEGGKKDIGIIHNTEYGLCLHNASAYSNVSIDPTETATYKCIVTYDGDSYSTEIKFPVTGYTNSVKGEDTLKIGLGVGIPLLLIAIAVILFLIYYVFVHRRRQKRNLPKNLNSIPVNGQNRKVPATDV